MQMIDNTLSYEGHNLDQLITENSWIDKFPWVVFDENAQEMYSKYCRKFPHLSDRKDALTRGTKNLRIEKHQEHLF
jgi:hypothetical protein